MKKVTGIILLSIVCMGVGGYATIQGAKHNITIANALHLPQEKEKSPQELDAKELAEQSVPSEEIMTNLSDGSYAKIVFQFVMDNKDAVEEVKTRQFQAQSFVIQQLSTMSSEAFRTQQGSEQITSKLKAYLNTKLKEGKVQEIYIKDKLVQ